MYPSDRDSDKKKDWDDCVVSIDDKGRDLKCFLLLTNPQKKECLHSLQLL